MSANKSILPPFMELPLDDEDCRFTQSFSVDEAESEEVQSFFHEYGFVIFREVISPEECHLQLQDMEDLMKETQRGLSFFGTPKGVNSLFRPQLLRLRQHPSVFRAFSAVLGTQDLCISHDRWLLHQPPPDPNKPLTKRNLHLDLNPWEYQEDRCQRQVMDRLDRLVYSEKDNYRAFISENNDVHKSMGPCVQSILNLYDVADQTSGGTILVPGSHHTFERWLLHGGADVRKRRVGPMQYKIDGDKDAQILYNSLTRHPTLRAGSLLIWDQRLLHGSTPNESHRPRAAIPIRAFSSCILSRRRAREREKAVSKAIQESGFETQVTDIGRQVFGLSRNIA